MDSLKNRIMKEYEDLKKNEKENTVIVWMENNNIRHWKGKIRGPVKKLLNLYRWIPAIKAENMSLTLWSPTTIPSNLPKWNTTPKSGTPTSAVSPELFAWISSRMSGPRRLLSELHSSPCRPSCAPLSLVNIKYVNNYLRWPSRRAGRLSI